VGAREALEPSAPKRIDGEGTIALIEAAAAAGVQQFVLVSSLGTGKVGGSCLVGLAGQPSASRMLVPAHIAVWGSG
jgi:nucleoside-diphosphate-sugar epimerase